MTLVLTFVAGASVLQVSDRLVSQGQSPYDQEANKCVILLARNGLATFGYTGLAYLDGVTTDHWIAEQLLDEKFPVAFGMSFRSGAEVRAPNLGMAIKRLSSRMTSQSTRLINPTAQFPRVVVAGLQWKGKSLRPIAAEISDPLLPEAFMPTYMPKDQLRYIRDDAGRLRVPTGLHCLPHEWLSDKERSELFNNLCGTTSFDEREDLMVRAIRIVAERESLVGEDCMSVFILNTIDGPRLKIGYRPARMLRLPVYTMDGQAELPAAYTPWLLSANIVQQPQVAIGGQHGTFSGIPIEFDAPPLPPDFPLLLARSHQRRKPDPFAPRRSDESPTTTMQ